MTIRRTRIACRIPKTKNTHWECIILIACPLQHWLHGRGSMLRYSTMPVLFASWFEFKHSVAVKIVLLHLPLFTKSSFHLLIMRRINQSKCATRRFSKTSSSLRADSTSVFDVMGRPAKSSSWKSIRSFRALHLLWHAAFSLRHRHTRPLVRQLAVGLSSRRHGFYPKSVCVRILVDNLAQGRFFSRYLCFLCQDHLTITPYPSLSALCSYLLTYLLHGAESFLRS